MTVILPFILIAVSLGVIIVIIVRKYPQLLLLDIDSLPEIQQSRKKDIIIKKRAEKESKHLYTKLFESLKPAIQKLKDIQLLFRKFVGRIERKSAMEDGKRAKSGSQEYKKQKEKESLTLVQDASQDVDQDDFATAEKKYLAALKADAKNKDAYKGLAHVYYQQGQKQEAKETYKFILQLDDNDEETHLKLGEMAEEEGDIQEAVECYQQAVILNPHNPQRFVKIYDLLFGIEQYETALEAIEQALELEPQNPKYLDNFVETSIIIGRKDLAEEGIQRLRMINPENQKLQTFKQRIEEL
ncbi:hypothetical protein C0581_05205 [Candidatus Parcubacteria bacterium]|nr:MAG: hypothetical protein C0581_05205 [Candidatus Parcubacteria bacterium]